MINGLFTALGDAIVIPPLYIPGAKPVTFTATERVTGAVLPVLRTESQFVAVLTVMLWPGGSLVTDKVWGAGGLAPIWLNDSELELTDIVGSAATLRVTCPVIGQKLAVQLTVTVPEYVPAVKLPAFTAMERSIVDGASGIVPAVGVTDSQPAPEFVEAEAVKLTELPLERESCQLSAEQDKLPLLWSYVQANRASVVAFWITEERCWALAGFCSWALLFGSVSQSRTRAVSGRRAREFRDTRLLSPSR